MRKLILIALFLLGLKIAWAEDDHVQIRFFPDPPVVGNNRALAYVKDSSGNPVQHLNLYLRTTIPGMDAPMATGIRPWPATEIKPGQYQVSFGLAMLGLWQLDLLSDRGQALLSVKRVLRPESHVWRNRLLLAAGMSFIVLLVFLAPKRIFTKETVFSVVLFFILLGAGYLYARTLKTPSSGDTMGMKMDMNKPDMGLSSRTLSAPQAVSVELVKKGEISRTATYSGVAAPNLEETLYPRVTGWLLSMPFYPGMPVHAGQVIGQLDTEQLGAETREAMEKFSASLSEINAAKSSFREKRNRVRQARAVLDYWEREIKREEKLLHAGAISQEEYDRENSSYLEALNGLKAEKQGLQASVAEISRARRMSNADQAAFQAASTIQGYTVLRAHINGIVTERLANEGVLVQPEMGIIKIGDLSFMRLQAHVAESDLAPIHVGTPVFISSPKLPDKELEGKVTSVFHETNLLTHTGTVEARIKNPNNSLFPGDYVVMRFVLERKPDSLSVSSTALVPVEQVPSVPNVPLEKRFTVWIVGKDGLSHRRFVVPGISDGERTEILKGLKPGEEVIDQGQQGLEEMDPVVAGEAR